MTTKAHPAESEGKDEEILRLRAQLDKANKRLSLMSEGIRLVACRIRHADLHPVPSRIESSALDEDHQASLPVRETTQVLVGEKNHHRPHLPSPSSLAMDLRLGEITQGLSQSQAADFLALQNAARMLQEHAQFSSQEAAMAVQDAVRAQKSEKASKESVQRMGRALTKLESETSELIARNNQLANEQRILVKEVRKLHKKQSVKQLGNAYFQTYVKEATKVHEQLMKVKMANEPSIPCGLVPNEEKPAGAGVPVSRQNSLQTPEKTCGNSSSSSIPPSPRKLFDTPSVDDGTTNMKRLDDAKSPTTVCF